MAAIVFIHLAYEADCRTIYGDRFKIGTFSVADTNKCTILNCYTQYNTSTNKDVFEYEGFQHILNEIIDWFSVPTACRFGLPYIGMGFANGNTLRIMPMIEEFADKMTALGHTVTLVEFERN